MYWCHNCSTKNQGSKACLLCSSQAIEEVNFNSQPGSFQAYTIGEYDDQPLHSLESLYRSVYGNLLQAATEARPQTVQSVDTNGNHRISYVYVLDASQDASIQGLSDEQVDSLHRKIVTSQCTICQQSKQSNGFLLECKHEFHQQCLRPWVTTNGTCPSCRFKLVKH